MYFNSDRPGGFGLGDIWISQRTNTRDDLGGGARQCGPGVNSSASDAAPPTGERRSGNPPPLFRSSRPGGPGRPTSTSARRHGRLLGTRRPGAGAQQSHLTDRRPNVRFDGLELFLASNGPAALASPTSRFHARNHRRLLVGSGQPGPHGESPFNDQQAFIFRTARRSGSPPTLRVGSETSTST